MLRKLSFWIFLLLIIESPALFPGTTGKIAGKVTHAVTGEPLFPVNVIIEETTLGAATDMQGN